jgi:hypothetical protein
MTCSGAVSKYASPSIVPDTQLLAGAGPGFRGFLALSLCCRRHGQYGQAGELALPMRTLARCVSGLR